MKNTKMLFGLTILVLLVLISVPSFAQQVLKIGSFNALTGPAASWGINIDKGIDLCVEDWNKKGGVTVKGEKYKIQTIHEDDKYRGEEAVKAVNKLIFTDKVKFIVGPFSGPSILAVQPTTEANKVIMICNSFAGPELLKDKPYTFRSVVPPIHSSPEFFKFIAKRHPNFKTCVTIAPNNATGFASAQADNDSCDVAGIKVAATEFFEVSTQDFTPMLTRIIPFKADFLLLAATSGGHTALIIKQARELGYKGKFVNSANLSLDDVGPIAGYENVEGTLTYSISTEGLVSKGIKDVAAKFEAKFGTGKEAKIAFAVGGAWYSGPDILLKGIEKADSLDPDKVRQGIENLGTFEVVQGKAYWGGQEYYGIKHQLFYPIPVNEVQDRKLITVGNIMPWEVPPAKKKWW
jgi:branched-chain amino acid transport system substrate-binding protein